MLHEQRDFAWLVDHASNTYSQFGEDGVLEAIFKRIGVESRWCLECGAADGLFFSNTRRLIEAGWSAVLVEADRSAFARLHRNCQEFGDRVHIYSAQVDDTHRLEPILRHAGAPHDLDLAVIDVDGQDYFVWNAMLRYRPRVVVIEFDPYVDEYFIPSLGGEGQAGKAAVISLGVGKFYEPVFENDRNIIFVKQSLSPLIAATIQETPV